MQTRLGFTLMTLAEFDGWIRSQQVARTNGSGNTKSCSGTAFFGGNTVESAQRSLLPRVRRAMGGTDAAIPAPAPAGMRYACVQVDRLNVRSVPAGTAPKIDTDPLNNRLSTSDRTAGVASVSSSGGCLKNS